MSRPDRRCLSRGSDACLMGACLWHGQLRRHMHCFVLIFSQRNLVPSRTFNPFTHSCPVFRPMARSDLWGIHICHTLLQRTLLCRVSCIMHCSLKQWPRADCNSVRIRPMFGSASCLSPRVHIENLKFECLCKEIPVNRRLTICSLVHCFTESIVGYNVISPSISKSGGHSLI